MTLPRNPIHRPAALPPPPKAGAWMSYRKDSCALMFRVNGLTHKVEYTDKAEYITEKTAVMMLKAMIRSIEGQP